MPDTPDEFREDFSTLMNAQNDFMKDLIEQGFDLNKAAKLLRSTPEVEVGQTPSEVIWERDIARLLHYKSEGDVEDRPPVLLVYALINEEYILDLQPGRSVVETLLDSGLDVYMIDWRKPDQRHQFETLDDYVNYFIDVCVDKVRDIRGEDSINLLGYCMGGTMSAMYTALHPEKVRTLTLMAAGLDFEEDTGNLKKWADPDFFDPEKVTEAFGNCPAEFLDGAYLFLSPVNNTLGKLLNLVDNVEDEEFVEMFFRMEQWIHDGKDVPGKTFSKFVRDLYQENKLVNNELRVGGEKVDLKNIEMPVLLLMGEYDTLVPPESSESFTEAIESDDTEIMKASVGHIGLSVSSKVHPDLWGNVADWIKERDEEPLTSIKGVGEKSADKLKEASIKSVRDLAEADTEKLSEKAGLSEKRIEKWKDRIRR
ncbi:MAG: class III poly(R)-hydroxyalkanoic acid synthase subunit PhaC [Candidatus Thermoplasmatota archaeon]